MKELLIEAQATLFQLFFKTWTFHYNVKGDNFIQLHDLFGEQKDIMFSELDRLSEHLRYLDLVPSSTLEQVDDRSHIDEPTIVNDKTMVEHLLEDNEILIELLIDAAEAAGEEGKTPTENLLQELAEQHGTFVYKLRSFIN